jgi:hypothetical protein
MYMEGMGCLPGDNGDDNDGDDDDDSGAGLPGMDRGWPACRWVSKGT